MLAMPRRTLFKLILLALSYFAAGKFSSLLTYPGSDIVLIQFTSGIALSALLRWGTMLWPGVAAGALLLNAPIDSVSSTAPSIILANTLGPLAGYFILQRLQFAARFIRVREIAFFAVAALIVALISSAGKVVYISLTAEIALEAKLFSWLRYCTGEFVGIIFITPVLLRLSFGELRRLWLQRREFMAWLAITSILSWAVFYLNNHTPGGPMPLVFTVQGILVWSAISFGLTGSSIGLMLPISIATLATHQGLGPFHRTNIYQGIFVLWVYLTTLVFVQLIFVTVETQRRQAEKKLLRRTQMLALHNDILDRINQHLSLRCILEALAGQVEALRPGAICSILLLDNERKRFRKCAAPSLPDFYKQAVEGLTIDEGVCACGTAAFTGQRSIIENLAEHPYGIPIREAAARANLAACWSQPILDHRGQVIGAFAIYRREPGKPAPEELSLIDAAARMAALAIERTRKEESLRASEEKFFALYRYSRDGIIILDPETGFIAANPAMLALLNLHEEEELIGLAPEQISPALQPDGRFSAEKSKTIIKAALYAGAEYFEWTYQRHDGTAFPCDVQFTKIEFGGRTLLQGHVRDITTRKTEERLQRAATEKMQYMIATSPTILFSSLFCSSPEGNSLVTYWISENVTRILGYTLEETLDPDWWHTYIHAEDRARIVKESSALFEGKQEAYEYRFLHKNRSALWIRDEQQLIRDTEGRIVEVLNAWTDITEHKREEQELRIAATAFETQEGIIITDRENRIVRTNRAFTRLTGYSAEEALGQTPALLKSGRQDAEFYQLMWQALERDRHWEGEIWNRRKNGEVYPEWLIITAITDAEDKITHYVAAFSDISQLKKNEAEIHALAFYDPLTGLPNRRLLSERLKHAQALSHRSRQHGALIFLDLDHFKILNDTQGHAIGDRLLIETAQRLTSLVREMDTVSRLGGDEFVVMLEDLHEDPVEAAAQVEGIAEKICKALAVPYLLPPDQDQPGRLIEHHSSASIGVTLFRNNDNDIDELMKRADMAMYQAKRTGRNTICFFDPLMQSALHARAELENDLRLALDNNEFCLHYQLQVDAYGHPVSAEALLRWMQPQRGNISPVQFIPLAEETGMISAIGAWVLFQACKTLARWAEIPQLSSLELAVNVSPRQFRQPDFVEQILAALRSTGANPARLKLEITESLIMYNIDDSIGKMSAIKQSGVSFTMDDFGTGYSSLSYLQRLPLEQLKIDRSFIRDLPEDLQAAAIVRTILSLGKTLEITTIAEGVENERQHAYLAEQGCPVFQGFLYAKPMPLEEFETFVKGNRATQS